MKKLMIALLIMQAPALFAQKKDTVLAKAKLVHTTVYYGHGAELQHQAKATLINGMQQLIIDNVALEPDINTFQVSCPEHVTILSYYHRLYTKPVVPVTHPQSKAHDTIKVFQKQVSSIQYNYQVQEDVLRRISALIDNNFTTPDKKNISSAELIRLTNYYTDQVKQIKQQMYTLHLSRLDIEEKIAAINKRIDEEQRKLPVDEVPVTTGQLIMQVLSKTAGSADLEMSYFTRHAGWVPTYDIRVKTIDNSFKIIYKAMVSQSTGLNWDAVKLNLSTSNPNQGTEVPALRPFYLQTYVPALYGNMNQLRYSNNLNVPTLNEVVVTGYDKAQADNGNTNSVTNVSDYMLLKESQLNVNFEIDLPYDIPSDGTAYSVTIKDEKVDATYQHFAIPKLDKDAFLLARLASWDSLNLMPGQANIIMDNVYLGKSFIDPNVTADTLSLSLGRDKRVAINRKLIKDFRKPNKGDTKTDYYTYEITVKNNKKQAVAISIKDQYPLSRVKEIEISLTDDGGAEKNIETGGLNWEIKLNPGESRKVRFSYQVKYPKDKVLQEIK